MDFICMLLYGDDKVEQNVNRDSTYNQSTICSSVMGNCIKDSKQQQQKQESLPSSSTRQIIPIGINNVVDTLMDNPPLHNMICLDNHANDEDDSNDVDDDNCMIFQKQKVQQQPFTVSFDNNHQNNNGNVSSKVYNKDDDDDDDEYFSDAWEDIGSPFKEDHMMGTATTSSMSASSSSGVMLVTPSQDMKTTTSSRRRRTIPIHDDDDNDTNNYRHENQICLNTTTVTNTTSTTTTTSPHSTINSRSQRYSSSPRNNDMTNDENHHHNNINDSDLFSNNNNMLNTTETSNYSDNFFLFTRNDDNDNNNNVLNIDKDRRQQDPIYEKQSLLKEIETLKIQVMDYEIRYQDDIQYEKKKIYDDNIKYIEQLQLQISNLSSIQTPKQQQQQIIIYEDSMLQHKTTSPMKDDTGIDNVNNNRIDSRNDSSNEMKNRLLSLDFLNDEMKLLLQQHLFESNQNNHISIEEQGMMMQPKVAGKDSPLDHDKDESIRILSEQMNIMKNKYMLLQQQMKERRLKYPYGENNKSLLAEENHEMLEDDSSKIRLELELEQVKKEKNDLIIQLELMTKQNAQQDMTHQQQEQQLDIMNQIEMLQNERIEFEKQMKIEHESVVQNLEKEKVILIEQVDKLKLDIKKTMSSYDLDDIIGQLDLVESEHKEIMTIKDRSLQEKDVVISTLSIQLSDAKHEQDDLEQLVIEYKEKYDKSVHDNKKLQNDIKEIKMEYDTLFQIHKEHVTNTDNIIKKECDIAREEMISSAEEQFEHANELYRKLKYEYDTSQQTIISLEDQYDIIQKQCIGLQNDIDNNKIKYHNDIKVLNENHDKIIIDHKEIVQRNNIEIQTCYHTINELRNQIKLLNDDYITMQATLTNVCTSKEQLQYEYNDLKLVSEELMVLMEQQQTQQVQQHETTDAGSNK